MPHSSLPPSVVTRANQLALQMLKSAEPSRTNLVLAPITTQLALQMTAAGAKGETANELSKALGLKPEQGQLIAQELARLTKQVASGSALRVTSGLYVERNMTLAHAFEKTVREGFHAKLTPLGFADNPEDARHAINRDVAQATNDKIPDLLPEGAVDALTRGVLVSAVHADLSWQDAFNPNLTQAGPFKRADGSEPQVLFMQREATFSLGILGEETTVIEIPYAGGELAMVVLLPPAPQAASKALYDADVLGRTLERLAPAKVLLKLPRFSVKLNSISLKPVLQTLGLKRLFEPSADLSGIAGKPGDLWVSDVAHGAFIDVNEKGTEAAGATAVTVTTRGAMPQKPIHCDSGRPFLFLIRQVSSGLILFVGRVGSP